MTNATPTDDDSATTPNGKLALRILQFYRECLMGEATVAPVDLIRDSQTHRILEEIFTIAKRPRILDYGCGNLRLLNALLSTHMEKEWTYHGADMTDPRTDRLPIINHLRSLGGGDRWTVGSLGELTPTRDSFAVAIVMNVLHELGILEIATVFENIRRLLAHDGHLFLVDTVLLPEGEPRFVPFYPWELELLIPGGTASHYHSKSGIPIIFYTATQPTLPCFHNLPLTVASLVAAKRDNWSLVTVLLSREPALSQRQELGLGSCREFDYAYLNAIVANANFRLIEYNTRQRPSTRALDACGTDLFRLVQRFFGDSGVTPSAEAVCDELGPKHGSDVVEATIRKLEARNSPNALFPIRDNRIPVQLTDIWDLMERHALDDRIQSQGLETVLQEALELYEEYSR